MALTDANAAPAWSAWAYITPVYVASGAPFARARLPMRISPDGDGRYADVRVIDDRGVETPYAIDPVRLSTDSRDLVAPSVAFIPGRGTQAVFDLGRRAAVVDSVFLAVDAEQDPTFFERVAIDGSGDRRHWQTLQSTAIVYRVADDDGKGNQRVSFAPTRSRWLRVRVLDPRAPFPLAGGTVARRRESREPLEPLPLAPATVGDPSSHRQVWIFKASQPFRPSAVDFEHAEGTFVRPVRIENSADGKTWTFAGDGTIARYADGTMQTSFGFPEDTAPAWRVVIENGDDAPLAAVRPVLLAVPHELVFKVAPGHAYRLLSSNPSAPVASYDLGVRLANARWLALPATFGASEPNAAYRDPRRTWRRFAWLLFVVVLVAAAVAGVALAVRRQGVAEPKT